MYIWHEQSTEIVDIDDGYMVIDAQALRKCGYPRWIYGHKCKGIQKVWICTMDIWS